MAKIAIEWIKVLTPLVILAGGFVVGWTKINDRMEQTMTALERECARSIKIDEAQDGVQREIEKSVIRIQSDIVHIKESVDRIEKGNSDLLAELRKR